MRKFLSWTSPKYQFWKIQPCGCIWADMVYHPFFRSEYLQSLIHILKFLALNLVLTYTSPDWHPRIISKWWSSICFGSDSSSMFVMDILSKLRTLSSYRILKPTQLYGPGIEQVVVVVLLLPTTYYSYWVSNRKFRENKICDTLQTTSKYTTTNFLKWRECNCTILYH